MGERARGYVEIPEEPQDLPRVVVSQGTAGRIVRHPETLGRNRHMAGRRLGISWMRPLGLPLLAAASAATFCARPAAAQSLADTVSVYRSVLESYLSDGLRGPSGPVFSVCAVRASAPPSVREDSPSTDTLPALTPRLRAIVTRLLRERHDLGMAKECDGFVDEAGRQGVYLDLSGPRFLGKDAVLLYSAMGLGDVWGYGGRCTWRRREDGSAWSRSSDCILWVSD